MEEHLLRCTVENVGGDVVLHLGGGLRVGTIMILAETLYRQKQEQPDRIILDLKGLTTMDAAGFAFLKANRMMLGGSQTAITIAMTGMAPRLIAQLEVKGEDRNLMEQWIAPYEPAAARREEMIESAEPTAADTAQPWLMVVDRDHVVRKYIASYLQMKGYGVFKAANEAEALELLRLHGGAIQLGLLDYSAGLVPTREFIDKMVHIRPELKIILMYGLSESHGTTSHPNVIKRLTKPVFGEQLMHAIREALQGPQG